MSAATSTALRKLKHTSMAAAKEQEHRMTMFGTLIRYRGREWYSALCKDCGANIDVNIDGTVSGAAVTRPCTGARYVRN